ncbi:unnamed protein product [Allacma fusca]|uniref:Ig-like domain-containing protein n=1 Tax=Allacma fusca TaxID=39272 RepID=A0A8J2P6P8_9HEXA|nr:unnamed protein product [Allacma fusca]
MFTGLLALTEREATLPTFLQEPPNRVDFLNEIGVSIPCEASTVLGFTSPQIHWLGPDNKILQNIPAFRTVFPNGTLYLHSFPPAAYRQDLHTTTYRCIASSSAGTLRSRDVHIRAVVAQQWVARVRSEPAEPTMRQRTSPILLKCEIDLIGGGRNFIEVVGWKWDQHHLALKPHSIADRGHGECLFLNSFPQISAFLTLVLSIVEGDEGKCSGQNFNLKQNRPCERGGRFHLLPNGDLIVDRLQSEDSRAKIICYTRHKLTRQEIQSPPFFFTFSG